MGCAARRGVCFSVPRAADFEPRTNAVAKRRLMYGEFGSLGPNLSPPLAFGSLGPNLSPPLADPEEKAEGALMDGEFASLRLSLPAPQPRSRFLRHADKCRRRREADSPFRSALLCHRTRARPEVSGERHR